MAGQGIVHTTQAGEGDAVIFGRESKLSPIDNILNLGAQKQKAKAQSALLKQKLSNDNQQGFYKQLQDIHSKVWSRDLPEITDKINDVIKYTIDAQRNGIDPFSDAATQAEIYGRLGNIQATAGASLNDKMQYETRRKELAADQLKEQNYNLDKSLTDLDKRYTGKTVADRSLLPDFKPTFNTYSVIPALDKVMGDNVKEVFKSAKVYSDAGNVKDANAMLEAAKQPFIQTALQQAASMIAIGRTTPEAVAQEASDYWDSQKKTALYDPLKVNTLELARTKEANLQAYRARLIDLASKKFQFTKSMSEIKNTEVDDLFNSIIGGLPVNTSALAGQDIRNPKTNEIVKTGTFEPIRDGNGKITGIKIATYKAVTNPETQEVTLQPAGYINSPLVSKEGKPIYSTSQIYQSKFANSVKSKTPATNYFLNDNNEFEIIDENQQTVGARKTNSEGNSGSTYDKTVKPAPKKEETVTYVLNGKSGVIPKSQEAAFIKKYPKAKKM